MNMSRLSQTIRWAALAALAAPLLPASLTAQEPAREGPRTIVVEMVDFAFQPEEIRVRRGDTIRFVQTTNTPHNVEFRDVPEGTRLRSQPIGALPTVSGPIDGPPPRVGPFLVSEGQTYEFVVGDWFVAGTYDYVCTPHVPMGMTGRFIVEKAMRSRTR